MSVDIFGKENKTELKDRDLAVLQQEKGTQVLRSLAQRKEGDGERLRQIERGLWLERDFK